MIMDTLAGIAFSYEAPLKSYMKERPKPKDEKIMNSYMYSEIIFTGIYSSLLCIFFLKSPWIASMYRQDSSNKYLMTAFFALFIFMGIFNCFNARTPRLNLLSHLGKNKVFIIIILFIIFVQLYLIYYGGNLFRAYGLSLKELLITILLAATVIPVDWLRKLITKKKKNRIKGEFMNQIDEKFQELLLEINRKSKQEVFNKIKENYNKQPPEIKNALENYYKTFSYWGKLEEIRGEYESLYLRATSLKEHIDDYLWLYNHLQDYRSKKLLYAVLNNWYNFDTTTTKTAIERNYDQYWDLDLIQPSSTEVIVDLGAYVGDTILTYINNYGLNQYQKIYAYEITPESIELLKNNTRYYSNIEIRKKAILDAPRTIYMKTNDQGSSANQISEEGEEILEGTSIDARY